jgi:dienelactone hydrolase
MRSAALILVSSMLLLGSACGGSNTESSAEPTPFDYDPAAPLRYQDKGVLNHDYPIRVHDVSFSSGGKRVAALLAMPPGKGPFPAVLYLHGSGGDRTQLIGPAAWMAARGVVAMTITMPEGSIPANATPTGRLVAERKSAVATVVAARRAVDALQSLPQVDDGRIGLVGWSAGARIGAILAGVDRRIEAFDLFSGGSPPVEEYAANVPENLRPVVRRELGVVDPLRWIAEARPHTVLLQDGRKDKVVPRAALDELVKAAGKAAEVRWYPNQGHVPGPAALGDQLDWMAGKLGVGDPVVKGANPGPS